MEAGDWDAVMAKLDAKAARAEQADAFDYAGDPHEMEREDAARRESGARVGAEASGKRGSEKGGRRGSGRRRSSLDDALSPAAAAALVSDEGDCSDADLAADPPALDRDFSGKSAKSATSAKSAKSAASSRSSDSGRGGGRGGGRSSGKGGKRRGGGRRSSITKLMGLTRRRSSDNTGDESDDDVASAERPTLNRGASAGPEAKGGGSGGNRRGSVRNLIRRASGLKDDDDDDAAHRAGSGHRRPQRRGSGAAPTRRRGSDDNANTDGEVGGPPQPGQRQTSAIRRTSATFSRTNFIGQNFLLRTLSNHPASIPVRVVKKTIDVDPDCIKERDFCGNSALHVACDGGCGLEVVEHLLERNADMGKWVNNDGRSALHVSAAPSCQSEERHASNLGVVASVFLSRPVNVVRTDRDGRTPLMLARLARSSPAVISFLDERAREFEDKIHEAEGELERKAENDEIDIPAEGLTLGYIAEYVNDEYGEWSAGKAVDLYGLEDCVGGTGGGDADGRGGDDSRADGGWGTEWNL